MSSLRLRRLPRLCRGDRRRRCRRQPLPARRCRRDRAAGAAHRSARAAPRSRLWRRVAAFARCHRRGLVHRLCALPRRVPCRRDRRRGQAHAHRRRCALHRLRAVPAGVSGRLHLDDRRDRRANRLGGVESCRGRPGTRPVRAARDSGAQAGRARTRSCSCRCTGVRITLGIGISLGIGLGIGIPIRARCRAGSDASRHDRRRARPCSRPGCRRDAVTRLRASHHREVRR